MPKADLDALEARDGQSRASKQATYDLLRSKRRQEKKQTFTLETGDGKMDLEFVFRAIGAQDYDRMVTRHPPTTEQKIEGSTYNINTFAPDLLAKVVAEPDMTGEQWGNIWNSPDWNRGELMMIFSSALEVCHIGMDVRPTEPVSE